ncbi:MAG: hypothetical protein NDI60_06875, partial [Elusimicrobiales bacterium]|nr:hypothetical protein [Elusimicrobiales bacterium]
MTEAIKPLKTMQEWKFLELHHEKIAKRPLRDFFASDPNRGERMAIEAAGVYFDYSKHRVSEETIRLLAELAQACGLRARIEAMFTGEKINLTEGRAALHTALRAPAGASVLVDGENVVPQVH